MWIFFRYSNAFIMERGTTAVAVAAASFCTYRIYQSRNKTWRKSQNFRLHTFILIYLLLLSYTSKNYSQHTRTLERPYYKVIIYYRLRWTCDIHCQWYVQVGICMNDLYEFYCYHAYYNTTRNVFSSSNENFVFCTLSSFISWWHIIFVGVHAQFTAKQSLNCRDETKSKEIFESNDAFT